MASKQFHLGDVLSITDGRLMSPRHMIGVQDILSFMTGSDLFSHQLPRARLECIPYLLKQHPQLEGIQFGPVTKENCDSVLEDLCAEYGEYLMIDQLPAGVHEVIDPESELAQSIHPDKILKIKIDPDPQ